MGRLLTTLRKRRTLGPAVFAWTGGHTTTITLPPTNADSTHYLLIVNAAAGTRATPGGWNQLALGTAQFGMYWRTVGGSAPAWPMTGTSDPTWKCLAIKKSRGIQTFAGFANYAANVSSRNAPGVTANENNCLLVTVGAFKDVATGAVPTLGMPAGEAAPAGESVTDGTNASCLRFRYANVDAGSVPTKTVTHDAGATANRSLAASNVIFLPAA